MPSSRMPSHVMTCFPLSIFLPLVPLNWVRSLESNHSSMVLDSKIACEAW